MSQRLVRRLVRLSAALVPRDRRGRWTEEWLGELEVVSRDQATSKRSLGLHALGVVSDALTMRFLALRATLRDCRGGLRSDAIRALQLFRRDPWHAGAVALCLGLGLSAALGTLAVVNGVLFGPIPGVADRSTLFTLDIEELLPSRGSYYRSIVVEDVGWLRDRLAPLTLVVEGRADMAARIGDGSFPVAVGFVSGAYFQALGARPARGRLLSGADDRPDGLVAVVSDRFRAVYLGKDWHGPLTVTGQTVDVVGVAEAELAGAGFETSLHDDFTPIDIWIPLAAAVAWSMPVANLDVAVRLPEDLPRHVAEQRLQSVVATLPSGEPAPRRFVHLTPIGHPRESTPGKLAIFAAAMMAAPLIVLAIACANVANLRLARASARVRDLAVRLSLGATRAQLVRLLVFESLALAVAGTVVGGFLVWLATQVVSTWIRLPLALDLRVAGFTIVLLAGVTMLAGLTPALVTIRRLEQMGPSGEDRHHDRSRARFRHVLVATQVALSLGLLVVAGLLARSLQHLAGEQSPMRDQLLVVDVDVSHLGYDGPSVAHLAQDLATRISNDRRVRDVAYSDQSLFCCNSSGRVGILPPGASEILLRADLAHVTPEWFETVGVKPLIGRVLGAGDTRGTAAVVDERLARQIAPNGTTMGLTLRLRPTGRRTNENDVSVEIIGVVSEALHRPNATRPDPRIYLPLTTPLLDGGGFPEKFTLFVAAEQISVIHPSVARLVAQAESRALTRIRLASEILAEDVYLNRLAASAASAVALLALVLAATGLFAATAYVVSLRSREIGIRLAVGAGPGQIAMLVVVQALRLATAGAIAGLAITLPIVGMMRSSFVGISPFDPKALVAAILVLVCTAGAAALVPAARAARIDPIRTLRAE